VSGRARPVGRTEFVGSDLSRARQVVAQAVKIPKAALRITGTHNSSAGDIFTVRIDSGPYDGGTRAQELWLATTSDGTLDRCFGGRERRPEVSTRGRRAGARKDWRGRAGDRNRGRFRISKDWMREQLRSVALVQDRKSHRVLGQWPLPSPRSDEETIRRTGIGEGRDAEAVYLRRREFLQNTAFTAPMTIDQSAGGGEPSRGTPHQIVCERSHCPRCSSERDLIFPKGISVNAIAARKPTTRDDRFAPR
jgi:hypothetical protein